ncbi:MAG: hypothetical protein JRE81_00970 [Deltaproteobacteria bacterium]|jgi:hypothetical protein|nr:hypothetical protein [Deltaproteobacteria bacterium]
MRSPTLLAAIGALVVATAPAVGTAEPSKWHAAVLAGGELNFAPRLDNQLGGHGWAGFDSVGEGIVGGGNLRLFYNTTKLHAGIERLPFADGKLAFFAFLEGEAVISQLLNDYFEQGRRISDYSIKASYAMLHTKLQWYPGKHQTLEIVAPVRHWWFGDRSTTSESFTLPADTWVFEPRIGYNFWKIDSPPEEWESHRVFPRIRGIAVGIDGGLDVRSDSRSWGLDDGRNDPGKVMYSVAQWLKAGWQFGRFVRLQLDQWGNYGWRQDDITRRRIGGANPYVIPAPGLPWPVLISERLFAGQLGLHLKAKESSQHEFGLLVAGGAFNDVYRVGALGRYGGAGGFTAFGDLRFGPTGRYQVNIRGSWAFPTVWLEGPPYVSLLAALGVRIF